MRNLKRTLSLFLAALMLASFMEPAAMVYASEPQTEPTAQTVEQDTSAQNGAAPVEGLADAQTTESVQPDPVTQPQADTDSDPKVPPEEPADKPEAPAAHLSGTMVVSADDIIVSYADLYKKGDAVTTKVTISAKIKNDDGPITDWMQRYKTDAPKASINAKVNYPEPGVEPVRNQRDSKADFIQIKETANVSFTKESLGLDTVVRRLKNVTIPVTLEVEVGGSLITIEETATFNIIFTNEPPEAGFTLVTNEMAKIDPDGRFFYVGKTISLTDKASDPEDDLASNEITIKKDGAAVAVIEDGKWLTGGPASKGQAVTNTGVTPDGAFTFQFSDPGTYTIEQEVTDTWGETTREVKTIKVSAAPEAPVSKIKVSSDYSLENETIKVSDVSTDPNDDIVKWEWDEVLIQNADGSTASAAGNVTGSLKNKGPEDGEDVVPGGELTFSKRGTYVIGLTVTDILGASNKSTITIKIVDNVPILKITPSNGIVNGKPVINTLTKPLWTNAFEKADAFDPHFSAAADLPSGTPTASGAEYLVVKQNRAVYLDTAESFGNGIRDKDTQWVFSDVNGYADFVEQNVVLEDRASNDRHKLFIAKEPGCFQLTVTLHNDYSDELAQNSPNDPSLIARTKTLIVVVVPDEPPEVVLSVINDEVPSFDENPSSITVHVSASAKSVDNDMLAKYEWKVFCDKNNDGDFTNDGTYFQKTGTGLAEIDIPIRFATGGGKYKVQLTVTESSGQPTISAKIDKSYNKATTVSSEFTVNWSPEISFSLSEFAYVDDTIRTSVKAKDEALASCTIDWELWRSINGVDFNKINPSTLPVCTLSANSIEMRLASPGYYMLKGTITDPEGHSNTHTSNVIRIYDLPQAIITDNADYRWQGKEWTYKESRKFTLSGANSQADDIVGAALHEIDHDKDSWTITPKKSNVYAKDILVEDAGGNLINSLDQGYFRMNHLPLDHQLAILQPGEYEVAYTVVNTYGKKSVPLVQTITIVEDTAPVITLNGSCSEPIYNELTGSTTATLTVDVTIESNDLDLIQPDFYTLEYTYDEDDDGDFDNDTATHILSSNITTVSQSSNKRVLQIKLQKTKFGNYQFKVWAKDVWGQETLESVPSSKIKESEETIVVGMNNTKPNGTFDIQKILYGNVIFGMANSSYADQLVEYSKTFANRFGTYGGTKLVVNVEADSSSKIDMNACSPETILSTWFNYPGSAKYGDNYDGGWKASTYNGVNSLETTKNVNWTGYLDWSEDAKQTTNVRFEFDLSRRGGHQDPQGWTFCTSLNDDGTYSFYAVEIEHDTGYVTLVRIDKWQPGGHSTHGGPLYHGQLNGQDGNYGSHNGLTTQDHGAFVQGATGQILGRAKIAENASVYHVEIIRKNSNITISVDGQLLIKAVDGTLKKGTYGPYTCSQFEAVFYNIIIERDKSKTLEQICIDSTWTEGAERFVIFAADKVQKTMSPSQMGLDWEDPHSYSRLVSLLEQQNIHVIILASPENYDQMKALTDLMDTESYTIYVRNAGYLNSAINQAEEIIKTIMIKNRNESWWVLINDDLEYNKHYEDPNGDPQWFYEPATKAEFLKNPSLLAQYFWYKHDPTYFDNSLGTATFDQDRLSSEITSFTKPGKYYVNYRIKDNPVPDKTDNSPDNPFDKFRLWSNNYDNTEYNLNGEVLNPYQPLFVHRKPVANYSISVSRSGTDIIPSSITVTDSAYDPDHTSLGSKGLQFYRWGFLIEGNTEWTFATFHQKNYGIDWINEMVRSIRYSGNKNIMIAYQVQDIDGPDVTKTISLTNRVGGSWQTSNQSVAMKDGAWSDMEVRWIANQTAKPIALFSTNKLSYDLGEPIQITDKSYSPSFGTIVKWDWSVDRLSGEGDTTELGTYSMTSLANLGTAQNKIFSWIDSQKLGKTERDNTYAIRLVVTDSLGTESEKYSIQIIIDPENNAPTSSAGANSFFAVPNPTVYEYDPYDETVVNPYYKDGTQYRGKEVLDWNLLVSDPDSYDKYGPENDSDRFRVQFILERYAVQLRSALTDTSITPVRGVTYPAKVVSASQTTNTSAIQPFGPTWKENGKNLSWGNYRITALITDIPNNGKAGSSTQFITSATVPALDLYVIPRLWFNEPGYPLTMEFNGEPYDLSMEVIPGETLLITATTSITSTGTRIIYPDETGTLLRQEMTPIKITAKTITWQAEWMLPEDIEEENLDANSLYYFDIQTYTTYGASNSIAPEETRTKSCQQKIKVLPIKLYDFNITGVTDPSVTFTAAPSGDTNPPIFVRNMAMDLNNAESLMKLSYAFEFEITSKGMKKDNDHVVLEPVFYGWDGTAYNDELDMYYISNDKYVKLGDTNDTYGIYTSAEDDSIYLGSLSQLTLPIECRTFVDRATQKWTGRYGLPGSAVFVKKGVPLSEEALYHTDEQGHGVLIAFNIYATKEGVSKYNYVAKGQWTKEFFQNEGTGAIINLQKQIYNQPWVTATYHIPTIVVNGDANALSNYETRPVWTK